MLPPTLRIARPTNNLAAMQSFYTHGLGLLVLSSFQNHAGFDGIMLGHPSYSWHLEFTYQHGVAVERAPSKEHLLVFYFGDEEGVKAVVSKVEALGAKRVESENPYWEATGAVTFEDPEGWRVVLAKTTWP